MDTRSYARLDVQNKDTNYPKFVAGKKVTSESETKKKLFFSYKKYRRGYIPDRIQTTA